MYHPPIPHIVGMIYQITCKNICVEQILYSERDARIFLAGDLIISYMQIK